MKFTSAPLIIAALAVTMVSAAPHAQADLAASQNSVSAPIPKGIPSRKMGENKIIETTGFGKGNVGLRGKCITAADCSLEGIDTSVDRVQCVEDMTITPPTGDRFCLKMPKVIEPEEKSLWEKFKSFW